MQCSTFTSFKLRYCFNHKPTLPCLIIQDKSQEGEKWVSEVLRSYICTNYSEKKKTDGSGVMSVVYACPLCRLYCCYAGSVLPLSPLILSNGSRWSGSTCFSWCTAQDSGRSHSAASKALWPSVASNSCYYLSNPQLERWLISIFFHVVGGVSKFIEFLSSASIYPFLSYKFFCYFMIDNRL